MTLVLGIDGGGTKTHAVVADGSGSLLGFATNGPSNWETVGLRGAGESLKEATHRALAPAAAAPTDVAGAAFGLAGIDWPSDEPRMRSVIDPIGLGGGYDLMNDSFIALRAGSREGTGVVLVAGTGAVAAGRNAAGETFRTLGQGPALGDTGSASDVSDAAVRAVADAYTGRGPATTLTEELCTLAGCHSASELLEQFSRGIEPPRSAAPAVMRAAEAGDEVSRRIVVWAGEELGRSAVLVAGHLEMLDGGFDVVLSGGLFRAGSALLMQSLSETLHPRAPRARLVPLAVPPVAGAVLTALDRIGVELSPDREAALGEAIISAVRRPSGVVQR